MNIEVVKPGMLTTVQDAGRYGYLDQGVVQSGAMDQIALRTANLLVGNDEKDAALELTVTGPVLRFHQPALIAVTGGGMTPHVDGQAFSLGVPIYLPEQSILTFRADRTGMRAYVAIAGGFDIPEVLNSQSTYLRAGFGGYEGRALKEGDQLDSNPLSQKAKQYMESVEGETPFAPKWGANLLWLDVEETDVLRAFPGAHYTGFTPESQYRFTEQPFTLSSQSDRMGYLLEGDEPLQMGKTESILSEAIAFGTVQVPPDGNPRILMADRQTTGGYPKIAQVAVVDQYKLAQLRPQEHVYFQMISFQEAETLYILQAKAMKQRASAILLFWKETIRVILLRHVDFNADCGESFGVYTLGNDSEILTEVTSANIACGYHAGDPKTMRETVRLALRNGVQIGAHPGLLDPVGFGRRNMDISPKKRTTSYNIKLVR